MVLKKGVKGGKGEGVKGPADQQTARLLLVAGFIGYCSEEEFYFLINIEIR